MTDKFLIISNMTAEEVEGLSFEEFCFTCGVTADYIQDLIDYGIVDLAETPLENFIFTSYHLHRVRTALHLQRDLDVNLPGAALVLDLIEEMEEMRAKVQLLEKLVQN